MQEEVAENFSVNRGTVYHLKKQLDESGINVDMTRFYARSKGGSRAVDAVPLWKPQNTTVLSSIRLNGETAYTTYSGGTTSERLIDYLRNVLIPTLSSDSIVVMDNMRSHHTQAVKDLLEQAGVQYLYLPPYSPDLNPIEKMWSIARLEISTTETAYLRYANQHCCCCIKKLVCYKLKAFLRKEKVRLLEKPPEAVHGHPAIGQVDNIPFEPSFIHGELFTCQEV